MRTRTARGERDRVLLVGLLAGFVALAARPHPALADGIHAAPPDAPGIPATALLDRLRDAARQERSASGDDQWAPADEQSLRLRASDEEILYREASFASTHAKDPAVEERMRALAAQIDAAQVGEDLAGADLPPERRARQLGLDRRDLVLRRYLVESMRLALATPPPGWRPSEEQVQRWYDEHRAELTEPARITLTQIFFSRARRGERALVDAITLREQLERTGTRPHPPGVNGDQSTQAQDGTTIEALGDAFPRGSTLRATATELGRSFGASFASAVDEGSADAEGGWLGPIDSPTGVHLVWVHRRDPGRVKPLDEARASAMLALRQQAGERLFRERMDELRARYAGANPGRPGLSEAPR